MSYSSVHTISISDHQLSKSCALLFVNPTVFFPNDFHPLSTPSPFMILQLDLAQIQKPEVHEMPFFLYSCWWKKKCVCEDEDISWTEGHLSEMMNLVFLLLLVLYYCIVWPSIIIATVLEYVARTIITLNLNPRPPQELTVTKFQVLCESKIRDIMQGNAHFGFHINTLSRFSFQTSSSRVYDSPQHSIYLEQGRTATAMMESEAAACKKMIAIMNEGRREQARSFASLFAMAPISDADARESIQKYLQCIESGQILKKHLHALETGRQKVDYLSQTEAAMEMTGYRGLVHWSKVTLRAHEHLLNVLTTISLVGSGLTYSSIFSASRGNVGLMCLAFVLFNYGAAIPIIQQSLLHWATHSSPTSRLSGNANLWKLFVGLLTYSTVAAVAAAVCILNLTLWDLRFTVRPDGEQSDVPMRFDNLPRPAAMLTFVVVICIMLFVIGALILHYSVNGWRTLFDAVPRRTRDSDDDHDSRERLHGYLLV